MGEMVVTVAFICVVIMLFATVLFWEADSGSRGRALRPAGLLLWLIAGNWTAKLGGLLVSIGTGALLRYLMLNFNLPAHDKIIAGVAISAVLGTASAMLSSHSSRRAISLALAGASLGVAYLTAYSAYGFFHFVADLQALALLFIVAGTATVVAITRRALSIAVLAMTGAYVAPAFALELPTPLSVYGYYVGASLVTLIMVWRRGWRPLIHLSFLFTLAGALFFCWTQRFYTPSYYEQMQPLLLVLVAIHLAMPLLESSRGVAAGRWARRFDQVYFYLLPLVAATLTLLLAPRLQREGAVGLLALASLWLLAAGWGRVRGAQGGLRYLFVAAMFVMTAGWIATTRVPVFLIVAVVMCLLLSASRGLKMARGVEILAMAVALTSSSCYVLKAVFDPVSGVAFLNLPLICNALLGSVLVMTGGSLRRREQAMAPVFLAYGAMWLVVAFARELFRLRVVYVTEIAYLAVLLAIGAYLGSVRLRSLVPKNLATVLLGLALFSAGLSSASHFAPALHIPLMLTGQVLYAALVLQGRESDKGAVGSIAYSALPVLMLPWALAFNGSLPAPHVDVVRTLLVSSAFLVSLQAKWVARKARVCPSSLPSVGFVVFGALLFYETLFHIERQAWAVAFELVGLIYLVETARFLTSSQSREAPLFGYVAIAAAATVSAAMLLRLIGPPGTLTILALNDMLLPAVVSLLWATIGGLLAWVSTRNRSRTAWSLGAMLLVAAALKLILLDFGSLGQLGNILAMMAAGGVFLLVAWLAPFPPRNEPVGDSGADRHGTPPIPVASQDNCSGRRWIWIICSLVVIALCAHWIAIHSHVRGTDVPARPVEVRQIAMPEALTASVVAVHRSAAAQNPGESPEAPLEDACRNFASRLPRNYLVYGIGDPGTSDEVLGSSLARPRPSAVDVRVNAGMQKIVVAFGSVGPTVWRVKRSDADNIVGVILSGIQHSEVIGLASDVPVLHAAYEDQAPCGYFQINPADPRGADRFVSELLAHAVAANFLSQPTSP
jgi:uncharacterized membrane protein